MAPAHASRPPRVLPSPGASEAAAAVGGGTEGIETGRALLQRYPLDGAGLYAILGLDPSASDREIRAAYRQRAARLSRGRLADTRSLRQLNMAYGILGSPIRRAEYDRTLTQGVGTPAQEESVRPPRPLPPAYSRPRHPHRTLRNTNLAELVAVLAVVAIATAAGALLIQRVEVDLSPVANAANLLGIGPADVRRLSPAEPTPASTPTPSPAATVAATPAAGALPLSQQFRETTVSLSSDTPARNTPVSVLVRLRRNGQPAANIDVWLTAQYRTVKERWPQVGAVRSDQSGSATITFNVGDATPGFPVRVTVLASVDGEQLSWPATFTPQ